MLYNEKSRAKRQKAVEEIQRIVEKKQAGVPLTEDENWVYWYLKNQNEPDIDEAISDFLYTCAMLKLWED